MKQAKVKLIRQMRSENERFRSWKQEREKELIQLRIQDRRRQNEMARMERLHTKQQTVLKRKVEEAAAVNKRLKVGVDVCVCARACVSGEPHMRAPSSHIV
jgi:kinesin family protein 4/21/27